jgi:hypothetical protein
VSNILSKLGVSSRADVRTVMAHFRTQRPN